MWPQSQSVIEVGQHVAQAILTVAIAVERANALQAKICRTKLLLEYGIPVIPELKGDPNKAANDAIHWMVETQHVATDMVELLNQAMAAIPGEPVFKRTEKSD